MFEALGLSDSSSYKIILKFLDEFKGVFKSCAIEEKNKVYHFFYNAIFSYFLNIVMSVINIKLFWLLLSTVF